ncbi:MAG: hypothetical protein JKY46_05890 [Robiginitomaculum sp.]|nr:hypothetical protein [Robiginitomaculum sp.]
MIEILQNILEASLEILLVSIFAVFGFSWDQPEEDDVDPAVEIEIVRLQTKSFDGLTVPVVSIGQTIAASGCSDAGLQLKAVPTVIKSEPSVFIT